MTTEKEIDDCIFRPQKEEKKSNIGDEIFDTIVYTIKKNSKTRLDGFPIIIDTQDAPADQNQFAYAKSIKFENRNKYYIKYASGSLINPLGLYSRDIYRKVGDQSKYQWKEVNAKTFKFYIGFLKTQNEAYYRNAERSMI